MFWYLIYSFAIPVILRWVKLFYFLRSEETMWFLKLGMKAKLKIFVSNSAGDHANKLSFFVYDCPIV